MNLQASSTLLGRLGGHLKPSGTHVDPSLTVLGPSLGRLGAVLEASGAVLGRSWEPLGRLGALESRKGEHPKNVQKLVEKA